LKHGDEHPHYRHLMQDASLPSSLSIMRVSNELLSDPDLSLGGSLDYLECVCVC